MFELVRTFSSFNFLSYFWFKLFVGHPVDEVCYGREHSLLHSTPKRSRTKMNAFSVHNMIFICFRKNVTVNQTQRKKLICGFSPSSATAYCVLRKYENWNEEVLWVHSYSFNVFSVLWISLVHCVTFFITIYTCFHSSVTSGLSFL